MDLVRLWMHECDRVYRDKLIEVKDMENYDRIQQDITKKIFEVCLALFFSGEILRPRDQESNYQCFTAKK